MDYVEKFLIVLIFSLGAFTLGSGLMKIYCTKHQPNIQAIENWGFNYGQIEAGYELGAISPSEACTYINYFESHPPKGFIPINDLDPLCKGHENEDENNMFISLNNSITGGSKPKAEK